MSHRTPRNESRLHWRLKRVAVHILMERGCNAVGMEISMPYAQPYTENQGRAVVDVAGIGPIRSGGPNGLWVCECKASLADLRAGYVRRGAHRHWLVVPEALADEARLGAPPHVGVFAVRDAGFPYHTNGRLPMCWRVAKRGKVMNDITYLPLFEHRLVADGTAWRYMLHHIAASNTWRVRRLVSER